MPKTGKVPPTPEPTTTATVSTTFTGSRHLSIFIFFIFIYFFLRRAWNLLSQFDKGFFSFFSPRLPFSFTDLRKLLK